MSNYRHYFDELNIEGFDYSKGIKCSVVDRIEKVKNSSINKFEFYFHQYQNKWKRNLKIIEISKKNQINLLTYYYTKIIRLSKKT